MPPYIRGRKTAIDRQYDPTANPIHLKAVLDLTCIFSQTPPEGATNILKHFVRVVKK